MRRHSFIQLDTQYMPTNMIIGLPQPASSVSGGRESMSGVSTRAGKGEGTSSEAVGEWATWSGSRDGRGTIAG
jgi:hypothetical protein